MDTNTQQQNPQEQIDAEDKAFLESILNSDEGAKELQDATSPERTRSEVEPQSDDDDDPDEDELFTSEERQNLNKMTKAERNKAKRQRRKERSYQEKLDLQLKDASNQQRIRELEAKLDQIQNYQQRQTTDSHLSRFDQEQEARKAQIEQLSQEAAEAGRMMDFPRQSALQNKLIDLNVEYRINAAKRAEYDNTQRANQQQPQQGVYQQQASTPEARYTREVSSAIEVFLNTNNEHSWLMEEFNDNRNPTGKTAEGRKAMQIFKNLAQEQDPRTSRFYVELGKRLQQELPNKYNKESDNYRGSPPMQTSAPEPRRNDSKPTISSMMGKLSAEERSTLKGNMQAMIDAGYLKTEKSKIAFIKNFISQGGR